MASRRFTCKSLSCSVLRKEGRPNLARCVTLPSQKAGGAIPGDLREPQCDGGGHGSGLLANIGVRGGNRRSSWRPISGCFSPLTDGLAFPDGQYPGRRCSIRSLRDCPLFQHSRRGSSHFFSLFFEIFGKRPSTFSDSTSLYTQNRKVFEALAGRCVPLGSRFH